MFYRPASSLWLVAWTATLCAIVLSGCGTAPSPSPLPAFQMLEDDDPSLSAHFALNLRVIGLRQTRHVGEWDRADLVPGGDCAAGAEMSLEQYRLWLDALAKSNTASMYADRMFTITPGRSASSANRAETQYVANWIFRDGGMDPVLKPLFTSEDLRIRPIETLDNSGIVLQGHIAEESSRIAPFPVAEALPISKKLTMPAIEVRQPIRSVQALDIWAPVRDGHALVVAHVYREFLVGDDAIRDHIFYVIHARRVGAPGDSSSDELSLPKAIERMLGNSDEQVTVPSAPPRFALRMLWDCSDAATPAGSTDAADRPALPPSRDRLLAVMFAAALSPEHPLRLSVQDFHTFVTGLSYEGNARTLQIAEAPAGVSVEATLHTADNVPTVDLAGRLSTIPSVRIITNHARNLRRMGPDAPDELCSFQDFRQTSLTFRATMKTPIGLECDVPLHPDETGPATAPPDLASDHHLSVRLTESP